MAEAFLAAAWAAGTVEGASVISNASKTDRSPLIVVPSLLYGTLALPLGLVGASPGPRLISSLPFAPTLEVLESSMTIQPADRHPGSNAPNGNNEPVSPTRDTLADDQETPITTRTEMIRKVREDNKRSLMARKQQPPPPPSSQKPARLVSSLDGRPLATQLAESMKRARFLFVGASIVMTMVSYQQAQQEQKDLQKATLLRRRRQGRDVQALQSLVTRRDNVVVRLVGRHDNLSGVTGSNGTVVPLLCPFTAARDIVYLPTVATDDDVAPVTYWNLGPNVRDWKETPLTKDWLFHPAKEDQSVSSNLVLEADVSCSPLSEYFSEQHQDAPLSIDRAMFTSNILGMIAKEKGILLSTVDDNTMNAAPVKVLIGSDRKQGLVENANTIYIHGPTAVGVEVASQLIRIQSSTGSAVNEKEVLDDETTPVPLPKTVDDAVSLLELVGMILRQGGELTVSAVTKVFANGETIVNVISDQPSLARWLQKALAQTGSTIRWYNATGGIDDYRAAITNREDVTFICCGNDEACSIVSSLLAQECEGHIVILVEEQSCASMLHDLVAQLHHKDTRVEILSVKGIHSRLFDHVRDLLASGKTPSEVQELMDLIQ